MDQMSMFFEVSTNTYLYMFLVDVGSHLGNLSTMGE